MATTELVIIDVEEEPQIQTLTKKQQEYELLKKSNIMAPAYLDSMYDAEIHIEELEPPKSSLLSIVIKHLIQYCIPICTTNREKYHIAIQSDFVTYAKYDNEIRAIAQKDTFYVIGISVPFQFSKLDLHTTFSFYKYISKRDRVLSGHYGNINEYNKFILDTLQKGITNNPADYIFNSEKEATKILDLYLYYLENTLVYYFNSSVLLKAEFKLLPYVFSNKYLVDKQEPLIITSNVLPEILNILDKSLSISRNKNINSWFDLDRERIYETYYIGKLLGLQNRDFLKRVSHKEKEIEYFNNFSKNRNELFNAKYESVKKTSIALNKYKVSSLEDLDDKQRKIVDLEYRKHIASLKNKNIKSNELRSLWSTLQNSFFDLEPNELRTTYGKIKKLLTKADLESKNLIEGEFCPHVLLKAEITLREFNKPWLNTKLLEVNDKFGMAKDETGIFCKVCGEQLREGDTESIPKFSAHNTYVPEETDVLQTAIWKEAMFIVSSVVKFHKPTPLKPFVNSIAYSLKNVISNYETKLLKSRTNTTEHIKDTLNIYSTVYIYAVLCSLMMSNPNTLMFGRSKVKNVKGSAEVVNTKRAAERSKRRLYRYRYVHGGLVTQDVKLYERYLITTALNLIIGSKEIVIARVKNATIDFVKQFFLKEAYPWARNHFKAVLKTEAEEDKNNAEFILLRDPFYKYLYQAWLISFYNGKSKKKPSSIKDYEFLLGRDIDTLEKDLNQGISLYRDMKKPEWLTNSDEAKYQYNSFMSVFEYVDQELFAKTIVPLTILVGEYRKKHEKVLEEQNKLHKKTMLKLSRGRIDIPVLYDYQTMNNFRPDRLNLEQYYCSDGQKHVVGSYVFTDKNKKSIEYTLKEINDFLKEGNKEKAAHFATLKLRSEKCKLCLVEYWLNKPSNINLNKVFQEIDDKKAFFDYFETRCPVDQLHTIVDNTCSKCKFKTDFSLSEKNAYFVKYNREFQSAQKEKLKINIISLDEAKDELSHKVKLIEKVPYEHSLKNVAYWSKITGVKYNTLINIGMMNGIKFEDVDEGRLNPYLAATDESIKTQVLHCKQHILKFMRLYNTLLQQDNVAEFPFELKAILAKQKKLNVSGLIKYLPEFDNTFIVKDLEVRYKLVDKDYANFLLEYLASFFVTIERDASPKLGEFTKFVIMYFTNIVIEDEKLTTKPESIYQKMRKEMQKLDDNSTSEDSPEELINNTSESSEVETQENYKNEIANFSDVYDVEKQEDIWEED